MTTLIWFTALIFAVLLPWGTNVPVRRAALLVKWLVIANVAMHLVTQGFIFETDVSPWSTVSEHEHAIKSQQRYDNYLDLLALTPSKLQSQGGWRWAQLLTANFIHVSWLHLVINMWLFALYAPNLEDLFGRRKFAMFLLLSMLATQASTYFLSEQTEARMLPQRGFSGVVYAVIGAYLVCFPRSRIKLALVYDFKYWGLIVFLLVPLVYIFGSRSSSLAELILLLGVVGIFVLLQPEFARFGLPAIVLLAYKVGQDILTVPQHVESWTSIGGHFGGFAFGLATGLLLNGTKGFNQRWEDPDSLPPAPRAEREHMNLAKMEKAARTDLSAARAYLGQRIFVGDATRATEFYINTVLTTYPDLHLDLHELHSLARMLEVKGADVAALRAYDQLLQAGKLQPGEEEACLSAARLCAKTAPQRTADALRYLRLFEERAQMRRDKVEVKRLREEILAAASARGEDTAELLSQAGDDARAEAKQAGEPHPSGYGGTGQPERRKTTRLGSRMRQIESSDQWPILPKSEPKAQQPPEPPPALTDVKTPGEAIIGDSSNRRAGTEQSFQEGWGKERLPVKTFGLTSEGSGHSRPQQPGYSHSADNPLQVPHLSEAIEKRAGLRRPPRLDLAGLQLPPQNRDSIVSSNAPPPPPSETLPKETKALDCGVGELVQLDDTATDRLPWHPGSTGVSEIRSDEERNVTAPLFSPGEQTGAESTQREASLRPGAEFSVPAVGPSQHHSDQVRTADRVYVADKTVSPSPDVSSSPVSASYIILCRTDGEWAAPADSESTDRLVAILSQELCRAVSIEELLSSSGVLVMSDEVDLAGLNNKLRALDMEAAAAAQPAAFMREPLEVLSMDFSEDSMVCNTVEVGRLRVPLKEIEAAQQSHVRLSKREGAQARELIELVAGGSVSRRLQLHERTFSIHNSKHKGEPLPIDTFSSLEGWLEQQFGSNVYARVESELSYAEHEALLRRKCLLKAAQLGA